MKRWLAGFLTAALLMGAAACASAEGLFQFMPAGAPQERLALYRIPIDEDVDRICLAAYREDDSMIDAVELVECFFGMQDETDFDLAVYALNTGDYYVQSVYTLEGTERHYILLSLDDSGFTVRKHIRNPGYTSGCGLINELANEEFFYSENYDWGETMIRAMDGAINGIFGEDGVEVGGGELLRVDGTLIERIDEDGVRRLYTAASSGAAYDPENAPAFASVYTVGDVNVRSGPGLGYAGLGVAKKGNVLEYLGVCISDERGVDWYLVGFGGGEGWVSAKYAVPQ